MTEHDFYHDHDHFEHVGHIADHADSAAPHDDQAPGLFAPEDPQHHELHEPEPELPQRSEPAGEWHADAGADDELRRWLDDHPPVIEPPPPALPLMPIEPPSPPMSSSASPPAAPPFPALPV